MVTPIIVTAQNRDELRATVLNHDNSVILAYSATNMNKQLERTCDVFESIGTRSNRVDPVCTIKKCIDILNKILKVQKGSDIYLFTHGAFLKREQR